MLILNSMDEILNRCFDVWNRNLKYEVVPPRNGDGDNYLSHEYIPFGEIVNDKPHGTWWFLRTNIFNEKVLSSIVNYNYGLLDGNYYSYDRTQSIGIYHKFRRGVCIKIIN